MPRFAMLEMSGKPESTDDIGKRRTSEQRSCGFAREAFYIKWGFFEFIERVRSPTVREGNTRDDRLIPQHKRSSIKIAGVDLPHARVSDTLSSRPSCRLLRRNLFNPHREIELKSLRYPIHRL